MASDVRACDVTHLLRRYTSEEAPPVERLVEMLVAGSSAPAHVEALGGRHFVLKLCASGLGPRALAAEYVAHDIGRRLGLNVPRASPLSLSAGIAEQERHAELSDLLRASAGINLGIAYLDGAEDFERYAVPIVSPALASRIVWFDALMKNVDRTARNPNLMVHRGAFWLIDHGACRIFDDARSEFPLLQDHLLLHRADELALADEHGRSALSAEVLRSLVRSVPEPWWQGSPPGDALVDRFESSRVFVEEAQARRGAPPTAIGPPKDRRPEWAKKPPRG